MSRTNDQQAREPALITPHYAPASLDLPWYRQRRFRRLAAGAVILIVAFYIAYVYRDLPRFWNIARLQNKCLAYTAPPDQIVYSELASDIATLPASSSEYWLDLSANPSRVLHRPKCWAEFDAATSGSPSPAYPVLFLSERSNGGERQLVCVRFEGWAGNIRYMTQPTQNLYVIGEPRYLMSSYGIVRHNGMSHSTWASGSVGVTTTPPDPISNVRFFAGRPDPKDPSRFTIAYEANGNSGIIEGKLGADTSVSLRIKDGPLKTPDGLPAGRVLR
jgi:hypothetical protein